MEQSIIERLNDALTGQYAVLGLLGEGGMASVYQARDERHGRVVAIKVLKPELSTALGPDRFVREIKVAAALRHPNLLELFDSGEADGLLYYVMPFIEGESLARRLERETQLPIKEALDITRQVALGLDYAHGQGVIHRDIKPDNILLDDGRALLADFGIAHALDRAGAERLTATGLVVGTPAYMSPEQGAGEPHLDGRADLYSLGCVLYEMLIGEPPFTGPTQQVILARHAMEDVPSLTTARRTIPEAVEDAVLTAMAKAPVDRYASGADFAEALDVEVTVVTRSRPGIRPERRNAGRWWIAAAAVLVVALTFWLGSEWRTGPSAPAALDQNVIAVMPFSLVGADDPLLRDLSAGLAELMYVRLPGDPGPRAIYPGTMSKALQDRNGELTEAETFALAADLGAGSVLMGQISSIGGDRLRLSASLHSVAAGEILARVEAIEGQADSLVQLVDRLTAELLVRGSGEGGQRFASLMGTDLPALRSYLAAQSAYGRGAYDEAVELFSDALAIDSTFALAALGLSLAGEYVEGDHVTRGQAIAWANRHRLGSRDSLFLMALAGPAYPDGQSSAEILAAWERAVEALPDRREPRHQLGELLFHEAPAMSVPRAHERAAAAFRQALAIDSTFIPSIGHLLALSARYGDTSEVRRLSRQYFALDSMGYPAEYYRWRVATALQDSAALEEFRAGVAGLDPTTLRRIIGMAQRDGTGMADVVWAAQELLDRSGRNLEVRVSYSSLRLIALNRGRPAEAARMATEQNPPSQTRSRDVLSLVVEALYAGGDSSLAATLIDYRTAALADTVPSANPSDNTLYDVCSLGLWNAAHGEWPEVPEAIRILQRVPGPFADYQTGYIGMCAAILEARWAHATGDAEARAKLQRLDSLSRSRPGAYSWIMSAANLVIAELREGAGDFHGAVAAARRVPYTYNLAEVALAAQFREEGRLADLTGDRDGAILAYQRYLALRDDPEPSMMAEVDHVRSELSRLVGEQGG